MSQWQADFYRRPLQDEANQTLWELLICDESGLTAQVFCPQSQVSSGWITQQLQQLIQQVGAAPDRLLVFRPQSFNLLQTAAAPLGISVLPSRETPQLKQLLQTKATQYRALPGYTNELYNPIALEQPPPLPLPENLWGDRWQFAALPASDLVSAFQGRAIPVLEMPQSRWPLPLGVASTAPIPGVIIEAGRRSMQLARWLQQAQPYALEAIAGDPDGLILQAGLVDRWVLTTFTDIEVIAAARMFRDRQQAAQGLHFLLVQPDNSGMTYSGFWLLRL